MFMNLDEYLSKNSNFSNEEPERARLLDRIVQNPGLIGIYDASKISRAVRLMDCTRQVGSIDLIIKTSGDAYYIVCAKALESRNCDASERRRLLRLSLKNSYEYLKNKHKVLANGIAAYSFSGSSKIEYIEVPREVSDILDFMSKGITA